MTWICCVEYVYKQLCEEASGLPCERTFSKVVIQLLGRCRSALGGCSGMNGVLIITNWIEVSLQMEVVTHGDLIEVKDAAGHQGLPWGGYLWRCKPHKLTGLERMQQGNPVQNEACVIGVPSREGEPFGRCSNAVSACGWIHCPYLSLQSPRFYRAGAPTKSIETWQLIAWLSGCGGKSSLAQWQMSFFNGCLAC